MSKLDTVVEELFSNFQQQFPLASRGILSKKVIDQRLDRFYAAAYQVRTKHHLWMFSWARVVLKLQQRLLQTGYPPDGVKPLLLGMIIASYNAK